MREQLIRYAFTQEELRKNAGLWSLVKSFGLKNIIKFIVNSVKNLVVWAVTAFGVTSTGDIYDKVKDDPASILDLKNDNNLLHIWRDNEGPFENIFRLASYMMPAAFGIFKGSLGLLLNKFLSVKYGLSFNDFGKWLDNKMNLGPGDDVDPESITPALEDLFAMPQIDLAYDNNMKDLKKLYGIGE